MLGRNSTIGDEMRFDDWVTLDDKCVIGNGAKFGNRVSICAGAVLGSGAVFGNFANIGEGTKLAYPSYFGHRPTFHEGVSLNTSLSFSLGDFPAIGKRCIVDGHRLRARTSWHREPMLKFGGGGSEGRTVYAFDTVDGIYLRAGCFFGTLGEFRAQVRMNSRGTAKQLYMQFADMCELAWPQPKPRVRLPKQPQATF